MKPAPANQLNTRDRALTGRSVVQHRAILEYLCEHPDAKAPEIAAHLDVSVAYIRAVLQSDTFRELALQHTPDTLIQATQGLQDRMQATAHLALDRLEEVLETSRDGKLLLDAFDKLTNKLGYSPKTQQVQNNTQVIMADQATIAEARELMSRALALPAKEDE